MNSVYNVKGFTLIELVMVLVITASLAAMVAPRFNNSNSALMAQANRLARDLRHVQAMAMNQGRTLTFDVQSVTTYRVTFGGSVVTDPATMQPYVVTLDNGVTLNGLDIEIDSLGRPVATGSLLATQRLFTLSGNSRTALVSLSPVTGFVEISP